MSLKRDLGVEKSFCELSATIIREMFRTEGNKGHGGFLARYGFSIGSVSSVRVFCERYVAQRKQRALRVSFGDMFFSVSSVYSVRVSCGIYFAQREQRTQRVSMGDMVSSVSSVSSVRNSYK